MDNTPNFNILELFPIPVFATQLPQEHGNIVEWFYTQEMLSTVDPNSVDIANYGDRSVNSYILDEPECKNLKELLLGLTKTFGDYLGYDYDEYRFGQSWLSYKHPGQHHTQHTHPNSLISGVFYFGEPVENTPAINFHKMGGGLNSQVIRPKMKEDLREIKYAWERFSVNFAPGLLLLFPSHLHHSVPLNQTQTTRCSLAFNCVPTIGFGDEKTLTELKF